MLLPAKTLIAIMIYASQLSGLALPPDNQLPEVTWGPHSMPSGVAAWTHRERPLIELNPNMQWESSAEFTCVLAHELTHYLQKVNGKLGAPREVEPPAYAVTAQCMRAYGEEEYARWAEWRVEACKKQDC